MTKTWEDAWKQVQSKSELSKRDGQQALGKTIFTNIFEGGQLVAEGPTGVGKSFTALIPMICAFKEKKQRSIITTETLGLLDQIVDKDLKFLFGIFGGFTYFGLKGRNHYLCLGKAGANNPIANKVVSRMGVNGERRDVEKVLGYRMDDEEWSLICGDTEFCAQNRCQPARCWSARARDMAQNADIVVTSHKMLHIHGEFIQRTGDGLLGDFTHIVIDEAHSLESVLVDGLSFELAPWDFYQKFKKINKGTDALSKFGVEAEQYQRQTQGAMDMITEIFKWQAGRDISMKAWGRESMLLNQIWLTGNQPQAKLTALDAYENTVPDMLAQLSGDYVKLAEHITKEMENITSGKRAVGAAATACSYLATILGLIAISINTKTGTVEAYGSTYAMTVDGISGKDVNNRDKKEIRVRAVPLDVSNFLRTNLWKTARSVTLISATLRDQTEDSFRYLKRSTGLSRDAKEIAVGSPFNFAKQQMIYLTSGTEMAEDIPGARFSLDELRELIDATKGRSLVLFTARAELDYAISRFRGDPNFPYKVFAQEQGADKAQLLENFKADESSVLLATKSFFTGINVPGDALSALILCKYSMPQYNVVTRALIRHWREQGFPNWYEMKSLETFVQAWGRLIRSADCKGIVALLDERVASPKESIYKSVHKVIPKLYAGSEITSDPTRVDQWLNS